jgi:aryl-alcohol dehydrogenase-like predicted oxidoreductase
MPEGVPPVTATTKSGTTRINGESTGWQPGPTTHAAVRAGIVAAKAELAAPGEPLFLWAMHHADGFAGPGVLEAALTEAKACVAEGLVRHIGLCNATVSLLNRAVAVTPLLAVQNEWSLFNCEAEKRRPAGAAASRKKEMIKACAALGVVFVAHSPLGGLKARRGERGLATAFPQLAAVATAHSASRHAVCLAAMLRRGEQLGARIIVIPGARTAEHLLDSLSAASLVLTDAEVSSIMGNIE